MFILKLAENAAIFHHLTSVLFCQHTVFLSRHVSKADLSFNLSIYLPSVYVSSFSLPLYLVSLWAFCISQLSYCCFSSLCITFCNYPSSFSPYVVCVSSLLHFLFVFSVFSCPLLFSHIPFFFSPLFILSLALLNLTVKSVRHQVIHWNFTTTSHTKFSSSKCCVWNNRLKT